LVEKGVQVIGGISGWLSALGVGTLLGVGLKYLLDRYSENRRRERERNALLRLISLEITHNAETHTYLLANGPLHIISSEIEALKINTWEAARVVLAQLGPAQLPQEDFDYLATYYSRLQSLIAFGRSPIRRGQRDTNDAERLKDSVVSKLKMLEESQQNALKTIMKYIEPTDMSIVGPGNKDAL
jgi:hypothetical protein